MNCFYFNIFRKCRTRSCVCHILSAIFIARFKAETMRISQLMTGSARTLLEKTGDWMEYVFRHSKARHLRTQVFNIPWYQYYLLDVMAFLVTIVTFVVIVIGLTCR